MKIMSWNVRGLGKREKRGKLKKLVRDRKIDILFLQETKLKSVNKFLIDTFWGHCDYDFMAMDAMESAGGILCIWNSDVFVLEEACGNRNFLILRGMLDSGFICTLVNVYGPCAVNDRRRIWDLISGLWASFPDPWCLGGDLNEVRCTEERQGNSSRDRGMNDLNNFIDIMELTDMPLLGRSFTWSNSQELEKWSRLDRFLLHSDWFERFNLKQWGLPRSISDHCPILLMDDDRNWGPKPFKFFNVWLENKECLEIMEKSWRKNQNQEWAALNLSLKLKEMKEDLKSWAKVNLGNTQLRLDQVE